MTTPYGATTFTQGVIGNSVRWLEATDPRGGKERVEYNAWAENVLASEPSAPPGVYNSDLQFQNTFYWNKKAMADAPYDYSKARVFHWLKTPDGRVSGIKHSEKQALESRVWYTYENQTDPSKVGKNALPVRVARLIPSSTGATATQLLQYTYNALGNLVRETDPVGRTTFHHYADNGIDRTAAFRQNPDGQSFYPPDPPNQPADKIFSCTYTTPESHLPHVVTDAAGQTTAYTYTSTKQVRTVTNADGITTYDYGDGTSAEKPSGYLVKITSPEANGASAVVELNYDDDHRVEKITTLPDGYAITTAYDDLDRPTTITYPDTTTEVFLYTDSIRGMALDLTATKDRLDRWTTRHYNSNRQMDSITEPPEPGDDPNTRTTHLQWCSCGGLESITDAKGNITTFNRDLQGRIYEKVFHDLTTIKYRFEGQFGPNSAGATSRLMSSIDALNQTTNYEYYLDNTLKRISYSNAQIATPAIDYLYDDNYNRIKSVTAAGVSPINYTYYPITNQPSENAARLATVGGVVANDTITYAYDALGRVLSQSINGVAETMTYDELGRLKTKENALSQWGIPFSWEYDGVTPRLLTFTSPEALTTNYTYFSGNEDDRRLQTIQNLTQMGENLSQFDYTYLPDGQVKSWSKLLEATASGLWFEYDQVHQLRSARNAFAANEVSQKLEYDYDLAGNRTVDRNFNPSNPAFLGLTNSYGINALNQVETRTVTSGGAGLEPQTFVYDAVGNMWSDGAGKTFEWDAANRLIAINYIASGNRTEFAYDGLGRRVKITEYGPGVTAEIEPTNANYTPFTTGKFTLPAGGYTLTLQGLNPNGGDNTVLIDSVVLNNLLLVDGSFEDPLASDYQVAPTSTLWSYFGFSGVAHNQGTYTSNNPNAPDGSQVAFVRNQGSLSRSLSLSAGLYKLDFKVAQRGSGNDGLQRLRVTFRSSSSVTSAKTFVWCGTQICEERDGSGAIVTKRFFAEGEQRIQGSGTVNYFYTRDHLGSIREVTELGGSVVAQYDYDPYGNRVVLTGRIDTDFGYTGHYFHAPSGLNLTLYRAYNPALGRWLSRDPIGEDGGLNLYEYVENNPLNLVDPDGLDPVAAGPPPVPVPGDPSNTWKWNPDPSNSRGGTWGPERPIPGQSQPNASWDAEGHWDVKDGKGNTNRCDPKGRPLTPQQAHKGRKPSSSFVMRFLRFIMTKGRSGGR